MAAEETTLASTFQTKSAQGPLLLADISGYTAFLQAVTEAHRDDAFADGAVPEAYRLMSSLLDGIVACIVPPFTLSKLEGMPSSSLLTPALTCRAGRLCWILSVLAMRTSIRGSATSASCGRAPARPVRERRPSI